MKQIKKTFKFTDKFYCECLAIRSVSIYLRKIQYLGPILEATLFTVNFIVLVLSIASLKQRNQIQLYYPVYGHYMKNSQSTAQPTYYHQYCHYFQDLRHINFVGFNLVAYYEIRLVIMIIVFLLDFIGIISSHVYEQCATKVYIFGLVLSFGFFVVFPSQFCINFGSNCIEYSPIFFIYKLEFMIQINLTYIGIGSLIFACIVIGTAYSFQEYYNPCNVNELFYQVLYTVACIPFSTIALVNFIASLFTSSAFLNILAIFSIVLSYILHNMDAHFEQINQKQGKYQKNRLDLQGDQNNRNLSYTQWQRKLYQQFKN